MRTLRFEPSTFFVRDDAKRSAGALYALWVRRGEERSDESLERILRENSRRLARRTRLVSAE